MIAVGRLAGAKIGHIEVISNPRSLLLFDALSNSFWELKKSCNFT